MSAEHLLRWLAVACHIDLPCDLSPFMQILHHIGPPVVIIQLLRELGWMTTEFVLYLSGASKATENFRSWAVGKPVHEWSEAV